MDMRALASWVGIAFMVAGPLFQLAINAALSRRDRKDFESLRDEVGELRSEVVELRVKLAAYTGNGNGSVKR